MVVAAEVRKEVGWFEFSNFWPHDGFLAGIVSTGFLFRFQVLVVNGRWRLWTLLVACGVGSGYRWHHGAQGCVCLL